CPAAAPFGNMQFCSLTGNKNSISRSFFGSPLKCFRLMLSFVGLAMRPGATKHNKAPEGKLHKGKDETGRAKTGEARTRLVWFFVTSFPRCHQEGEDRPCHDYVISRR